MSVEEDNFYIAALADALDTNALEESVQLQRFLDQRQGLWQEPGDQDFAATHRVLAEVRDALSSQDGSQGRGISEAIPLYRDSRHGLSNITFPECIQGRLYLTAHVSRGVEMQTSISVSENKYYAIVSFQSQTQSHPIGTADTSGGGAIVMFNYLVNNGTSALVCDIYKRRLLGPDVRVGSCRITVREILRLQSPGHPHLDQALNVSTYEERPETYWGFQCVIQLKKTSLRKPKKVAIFHGRLVDFKSCSLPRAAVCPNATKAIVTEMHWACMHSKPEILADIIYALALYGLLSEAMNATGLACLRDEEFKGVTALDVALLYGSRSCARVLLERAGLLCARQFMNSGRSVFHCAAMGGHEVVLLCLQFLNRYNRKIAEFVTVRDLLNSCDAARRSPLMVASMQGDSASARHLVRAGCDMGQNTGQGLRFSSPGGYFSSDYLGDDWTPLMYAAAGGHIDIVKALLKCRRSANVEDRGGPRARIRRSDVASMACHPLARTTSGCNVVIIATAFNRLDVLRELRRAGVPLSLNNAKTGDAPLHVAAACGHWDICAYFLVEEAMEWGSEYGDKALRKELLNMTRLSALYRQIGPVADSRTNAIERRHVEKSVMFHLFPKLKLLRSMNAYAFTPAELADKFGHEDLGQTLRSADICIYGACEPQSETYGADPLSDSGIVAGSDVGAIHDYETDHAQYVLALVPSQKLPLWRAPDMVV
jgi:ankyrin repeat protein